MSKSDCQTAETEQGPVNTSCRPLTVEIGIEFGAENSGCPASCPEEPIDHHLIDDTCYFTYRSPDAETEIIHGEIAVNAVCACRILANHGCIPSLQFVDSGRMVLRTNPQNRTVLRDLIADLQDVVEDVRIRSLVVGGDQECSKSALVNLQELTSLERKTVEKAILLGHYDQSGGPKFDELAGELDITKSALSKRLNSAESKVMRKLYSSE